MKHRKLLAVCSAALLLATMLAGCTPSKPITTGAFDGNSYANDFFGLSFTAPDGWHIANKDEMKSVFKATDESVGSDDKEAEKKMELSKQKELYLAYTSMLPMDSQESNPNMSLVTENLNLFGAVIKDGKAYVKAAMDTLKSAYDSAGMPYKIGDIVTETINGVEFAKVESTLGTEGFTMNQRLLCTVKNNYAIVFTLTWMDETELVALQSMVDTIKLK